MPIARITSLLPDGRPPYNSQNGLLYGFAICFSDGAAGLVNTKSQTPPYKVGDEMTYEVTGKAGSKDKMKVKKTDQTQGYQAQTAGTQPPSNHQPIGKPVEPLPSIHGATVGLAVKESIALTVAANPDVSTKDPRFWADVHVRASAIIRLCNALEHGNLTPALSGPAASGRADAPVTNRKPPAGENGEAFPRSSTPVADEDVPF